MQSRLFSKLFEISYGALFRNLEGITHADSLVAPPHGNTLNWVLGHMLATRNRLLPLVGAQPPWPKEMARRYSGRDDADWSPETAIRLDDIKTDFAVSQQHLLTALDTTLDLELSTQTTDGRPVSEVIGFLYFHEVYHSGQIALLRRIIGREGVIKPPAPSRAALPSGGSGPVTA